MSIFNTPEGHTPTTSDEHTPGSFDYSQLVEKRRSGAHWFYWIAALSLVTSFVSLAGGRWGFFLSLGVTQVIDGLAVGLVDEGGVSGSIKAVAIVFDLLVAGGFALLGYLGARGHIWAFILGMAFYALDALIFVAFSHWLPVLFHAFALYCIFVGFRAASQLKALDAQRQVAHAPAQ